MKILMKRGVIDVRTYRYNSIPSIIEPLFFILPLIDTFNGIFVSIPIGIVYKAGLCLVLLVLVFQGGRIRKRTVLLLLLSTSYIIVSIIVNVVFGGRVANLSYPIKLLFNLLMMALLVELANKGIMNGKSFYNILDRGSWVFLACFFVPYFLGIGRGVYIGNIGYKAFFLAQNELGLIIVVLTFFEAYKLSCKILLIDLIKVALLMLCGLMLNTKTAVFSCLMAIVFWILPVFLKSKTRTKLLVFCIIISGFLLLRDPVVRAIQNSASRLALLTTKHYNNSFLTGILSGRNYYLSEAFLELKNRNAIIHLLIGNGFCSDILIEMDLFDIYFYLGTIGLILTLGGLTWIYTTTKKNVKYDNTKIRILSVAVIYGLLFFAGHVLFMAMSGCYFVLYSCFLIFYSEPSKTTFKSMIPSYKS